MVNEDVSALYDSILGYLSSKQAYLSDPSNMESEFNDIPLLDLTNVVYTIQRQIVNRGSLPETATIKAYRDIHSADQEYGLRRKKRADYWADAAVEEQANIDKWTYNKTSVGLHMIGKDSGA